MSQSADQILIREYRPADFPAARRLWLDLVEHHRNIYNDASIGGADPGKHFEEYLAKTNLAGPWLAESGSSVIGLTGLLMDGVGAEIEPVVVSSEHRSAGVGTRLIEYAKEEAQRRGVKFLIIRPAARNIEAMRC